MWKDRALHLLSQTEWPVGLLVKNLRTGEVLLSHRADKVFPSCSVIKVPILVALFDEEAAGRLSLGETVPPAEKDIVEGSGLVRHLSRLPLTLRDHALLMIALSDNTSTNHLISRLGMDTVNAATRALGMNNTALRRKMMDLEAKARGEDNFTSCEDMLILFEHICEHPDRYADALHILKQQQCKHLLGGLLDADAFEFAHKTGGLPHTRLDVGVMYLRDPVFVSLMSAQVPHEKDAMRLAHEIGLLIYENN